MSDVMEPEAPAKARFCFVIDGVEPFYDKTKFFGLIVAAVQLIDPTDLRPTRTILAEKFGDAWSGEKLKKPLFLLAQSGHLIRVTSRRYVVAK